MQTRKKTMQIFLYATDYWHVNIGETGDIYTSVIAVCVPLITSIDCEAKYSFFLSFSIITALDPDFLNFLSIEHKNRFEKLQNELAQCKK